jgi:aerobic-type carbon monoxide dehydrogenase small subunit (CoxS/CutS family)
MTVNGRSVEGQVEARLSLADFLRRDCGVTGVRVGCEEGACGACTVALDGPTARSCLTLAVSANGSDILTVEGLADGTTLHPLQRALHEHHGTQCGFCASGVLMTMRELLLENPQPTEVEIRERLGANLCRCTGYQFIVQAVVAAAEQLASTDADLA